MGADFIGLGHSGEQVEDLAGLFCNHWEKV